jgi:hypothetical protein
LSMLYIPFRPDCVLPQPEEPAILPKAMSWPIG